MLDRINHLEKNCQRLLERDAVDFEDKQEASAKLEEIDMTAARLHRDEPFKRFLQQYISEEHRRDDREEPLCRCSYAECDLKNGKIPGRVRLADHLQSGIDDFQERHPDGVILLEARDTWIEMLSEYRSTLREVQGELMKARAQSEPHPIKP